MGKQKKLTPKQLKFARLISEGKSHADALRGSYNCEKMNPDTIRNKAYKLLQESHISATVDELKRRLDEKHLITREEMILDYMKQRRVDVIDLISHFEEVDGVMIPVWIPLEKWSKDQRRCVKSIKTKPTGIEIEFFDRLNVDDRIAKMLGWDAPTKHEIKNVDEFAELTDEEINKQLELAKMGRN